MSTTHDGAGPHERTDGQRRPAQRTASGGAVAHANDVQRAEDERQGGRSHVRRAAPRRAAPAVARRRSRQRPHLLGRRDGLAVCEQPTIESYRRSSWHRGCGDARQPGTWPASVGSMSKKTVQAQAPQEEEGQPRQEAELRARGRAPLGAEADPLAPRLAEGTSTRAVGVSDDPVDCRGRRAGASSRSVRRRSRRGRASPTRGGRDRSFVKRSSTTAISPRSAGTAGRTAAATREPALRRGRCGRTRR